MGYGTIQERWGPVEVEGLFQIVLLCFVVCVFVCVCRLILVSHRIIMSVF